MFPWLFTYTIQQQGSLWENYIIFNCKEKKPICTVSFKRRLSWTRQHIRSNMRSGINKLGSSIPVVGRMNHIIEVSAWALFFLPFFPSFSQTISFQHLQHLRHLWSLHRGALRAKQCNLNYLLQFFLYVIAFEIGIDQRFQFLIIQKSFYLQFWVDKSATLYFAKVCFITRKIKLPRINRTISNIVLNNSNTL